MSILEPWAALLAAVVECIATEIAGDQSADEDMAKKPSPKSIDRPPIQSLPAVEALYARLAKLVRSNERLLDEVGQPMSNRQSTDRPPIQNLPVVEALYSHLAKLVRSIERLLVYSHRPQAKYRPGFEVSEARYLTPNCSAVWRQRSRANKVAEKTLPSLSSQRPAKTRSEKIRFQSR